MKINKSITLFSSVSSILLSLTLQATTPFIESQNEFALNLYHKLAEQSDTSNVFFSPLSISSVFAMVNEGACGSTADQIQKAFHFAADIKSSRNDFKTLHTYFNNPNKHYTLNLANNLWIQKDFPVYSSFLQAVQEFHFSNPCNVDFVNETADVCAQINNWCAQATHNKITSLISQKDVTSLTRMIVTNAIYFKGNWVNTFNKSWTMKQNFLTNNKSHTLVDMMHQKAQFNYTGDKNFQALELPYLGDDLSMLVILPTEAANLKAFESSCNNELLTKIRTIMSKKEVSLFLPKFSFEISLDMIPTLTKMGITDAFNERAANFSKIAGGDGENDLYIANVIHKAFIQVDEQGSEAAASTAAIMNLRTSVNTKLIHFNADHPFLFFIQQKNTGLILFAGRVNNPTA